jgi:hypothetical protein
MRVFQFLWSIGLTAAALSAQSAGIPPEWETRKLLDSLVANAKKLEPLVNDIDPAAWREKGAPDAYLSQRQSVQNSLAGLKHSSAQLSQEPTRLSFAIEALFRLEAVNTYLGSLAAGVRRYQNPALADLLMGVADENGSNRESLKQYILDLTTTKEGEFRVMETEAQRCLGMIVKTAPPSRPKAAAPVKKSNP